MLASVSSVILYVLLALVLLLLPGTALLRLCLPPRCLGLVCRLVLAPGITVALTVLLLAWCYLFGLKPGPILPWLLSSLPLPC